MSFIIPELIVCFYYIQKTGLFSEIRKVIQKVLRLLQTYYTAISHVDLRALPEKKELNQPDQTMLHLSLS